MSLISTAIIFSSISALPALFIGRVERSLLWWYCILSFAADVLGYCLSKCTFPRFWVSNVFILGEWILVSAYFIRQITDIRWRKYATLCSYLFSTLFIFRTIYQSIFILNYGDASVFYALLIIASMLGFYQVIKNIEFLQIERSPLFIFCSGFILYVSGTLIMLLIKKYLDNVDVNFMNKLWILHNILNILKNLAIAYSLLLIKRQRIGE